jgi:hypothetical protein
MSASVEQILTQVIAGLSAFRQLSPAPTVRPYKIPQSEFKAGTGALAVIVESPEETHQNDLDGRGGGVSAAASVEAVAEVFDDAWNLAEIIRTNGTNPGTGLAGFTGTVAGSWIQRISVDVTHKGFVAYEDGSDEGYYFVRHDLTVDFSETA